MMKNLLFKTILVAAGLCVGMSAWGTITDTEVVNCNFNSGETLFTGVERCTVSNGEDATLNSNVVKFATAQNATNNYGLAKYNLGSALSGASSVDISFDMFIDNSAPNYHKYFAIGDGSKRTYAKQSYDGSGCFFYVGLYRSSSVNYFSINGSKINNSSMFGTWLHVAATLDFVTRQVTYVIKDITKTTTHYSGTIAFADNSVEDLTQIDYYGCINSNTAMMDNLVITKYVDDTVVDYSIKAVDGGDNELAALAKGKAYNDGSTTAKWSKYVKVNDIWYSTSSSTFTKTITETTNEKVTYVVTNAEYFYEMEHLTRSGGISTTETSTSYSNGTRIRLARGSVYYTPALTGGTYKLLIPWENGNNNESEVYVYTRTAGGELSEEKLATFKAPKGSGTFQAIVEVPNGYSLAFNGNEGGSANNNARLDYLILTRLVPVTLGTNGYATFACPYPLDLTTANMPTGLTAYKAAVSGTTVTFTELNQTVPANTGILLQGGAGETYNIPVVASGTAVSENAFLVNEDGATFDAESGYSYFGLIKDSSPLTFGVFAPGSVAIPANKAYLKVLTSSLSGSRLIAVFEDEATGISEVRGEMEEDRGYYNLSGQRVAKPSKGLYIVNGKKIMK